MKKDDVEKIENELYQIIYVSWEESERDWGIRPDGCTLHLTLNDFRIFEKNYWKEMEEAFGKKVPNEYSRPAGRPVKAYVSKRLCEQIENSINGIRLWNYRERELVKNRDLVYGPERSGWVSDDRTNYSIRGRTKWFIQE